jgi:hypothetical protein
MTEEHRREGYRKILFVRHDEWPVHYYRLLGLAPFEDDPHIIADAYDSQMEKVRRHQLGPFGDVAEQIQTELSRARLCLLKPDRKAQYDERLQQHMQKRSPATAPSRAAAPPVVAAAPSPHFKPTPQDTDDAIDTEELRFDLDSTPSRSSTSSVSMLSTKTARRAGEGEAARWAMWIGVPVAVVVLLAAIIFATSSSPSSVAAQPTMELWPLHDEVARVGEETRFLIVTRSNDEPETLQFELSSTPVSTGARISSQGEFLWQPSDALVNQAVTFQVTVTRTDGAKAEGSFTVRVRERRPATPPVIAPLGRRYAAVGRSLDFQVLAQAGAFGERLSYRLADAPPDARIDEQGRFSWTPGENDGDREHTMVIEVTSDSGASARETLLVEVRSRAARSLLPERVEHRAMVGREIVIPVTARPEASVGPLEYRLRLPVPGAMFDSEGQLRWTPRPIDAGKLIRFQIEIASGGKWVEETIFVHVKPMD